MEKSRWGLEVPPIGESNVVSVLGGYGNLNLQQKEHVGTVHRGQAYTRPVPGGGAAAGRTGG